MKFLLIDDHKIIREGLKQILLMQYPFARFEEGSNAEEVVDKLKSNEFDVVISDLSMPGRSGLDVVKQIKELKPKLPVLILSMHPEEQYAIRALKAGAWGYLNKSDGAETLFLAIKKVLQGRKFIPPSIAEQLVDKMNDSTKGEQLHHHLSNREFHIFKMIAEGKSISEISELLSLSLSTVSTHRMRILKKLQMKTNADLTRYAIENSLL